jgi:ABC-type transport system substrate-binding protein
MIADNMRSIGINANVLITDWGIIYARALAPGPSTVGKSFADGGFDGLFIGYALPSDGNPYDLFSNTQFAPAGGNYYLWNDSTNEALLKNITTSSSPAAQLAAIKEWQACEYEQIPSIAIAYPDEVNAYSNGSNPSGLVVNGSVFASYQYPLWPSVERLQYMGSTANNNSITIAQSGPAEPEYGGSSLSPYQSGSYYDLTVYGPIYGEGSGFGLLGMDGGDQVTPFGLYNYTAAYYYAQPQNYLAGAPITNYTFYIKPGIRFQNGENLTGRDVVWTLRYDMTPAWGGVSYAYMKAILGSNKSVYWQGEPGIPSRNTTLDDMCVHFNLTSPWGFFLDDIGLSSILPSSVLVNSSSYLNTNIGNWNPKAAQVSGFSESSFSTGNSSNTYVYYFKNGSLSTPASGPFGFGPYKYAGTDLDTSTSHLVKWSGYFNWATLNAEGFPGIQNYYVINIPDIISSIAALKAGNVQILDAQYQLQNSLTLLDPAWSSYVSYVAFDVQELGLNMESPIWGTGVATPLGQQIPSRAAEAALDVRRALQYCVPKNDIIETYMNGLGTPGITSAITPITTMPNGQSAFIGFNSANYSAAGFTTQFTYGNWSDSQAHQLAIQELEAAGYTYPPATDNDLAVTGETNTSVTLTWTAPGADGMSGNATGYVIKYLTSGNINASNWDLAATYTQSWTPARNGSIETHVVTGLKPGTTYWFAIQAYNSIPYYSGISNSPSATTLASGGGLPGLVELMVLGIGGVVVVVAVVAFVKFRKPKVRS